MIHKYVTERIAGKGAHAGSGAESATGKHEIRLIGFWMALTLFFIGALFVSPLHAAIPDAQKAAIAAGVAAGTDIAVIMQNAVSAGLTPEEAVQELVRAGADPGRVVYEAITAKYSAEEVSRSAATAAMEKYGKDCKESGEDCQAVTSQMAAIYSAALQAGASSTDVNGWLAGANVPSTVIANAGTQSGQPQGPAEGYSAPGQGPALTSLIGGVGGAGGGSIGGAGVGSPTKPASATKP